MKSFRLLTIGWLALVCSVGMLGAAGGTHYDSPPGSGGASYDGTGVDEITASTSVTSAAFISGAADPADAGAVQLGNTECVNFEASPAGTDFGICGNSSEQLAVTGSMVWSSTNGPAVLDFTASSSVAVFRPWGVSANTGVGASTANALQLIANGVQTLEITPSVITVPSGAALRARGPISSDIGSVQIADDLAVTGAQSKGQLTSLTISNATLTCSGGGDASLVTSGLIPDGAFLIGVTVRVTTALTGPTSWDAGDGSDVDRYAASKAVSLGTTSNNADATGNWNNPHTVAAEVTITFNGGNCTAGVLSVNAHYMSVTAPTSN